MATRAQLIQLVHVAKRELALDDDAYQAAISSVAAGKSSCSQLQDRELEQLLESFKAAGFKRRLNPVKKPRLSPASGVLVKAAEISKIRAIWITMRQHGFVQDGSETALNSYVQRMTAKLNGGEGVAEVRWLNEELAVSVLEALKAWHRRVMMARMIADFIQPPLNGRTGQPAGYDAVRALFDERYEDEWS
jgi:phage gp16-like protein